MTQHVPEKYFRFPYTGRTEVENTLRFPLFARIPLQFENLTLM